MPRQPRIDSPGSLHHVIARGIERGKVFLSGSDCEDFLARFARLLPSTGCECFAWALMPNHLHLLLRSGSQGISRLMQRLLTGYAVSFNLRYQRVGHLFQNRFKSILCEAEPYFLQLVRYIHLNPLRAGIVKSLDDLARYPWTGHGALMGAFQLNWQNTEEVLQRWSGSGPVARAGYERFVQDGLIEGYREDLEGGGVIRSLGGMAAALQARSAGLFQRGDVRILGSGEFVEKILGRTGNALLLPRQSLSLDGLLGEVSARTGVERERLVSRDRTRAVSRAKALLIYWGVTRGGKTLRQMARLTSMSDPAAGRARLRGEILDGVEQVPAR